jgi:hypothetical protein
MKFLLMVTTASLLATNAFAGTVPVGPGDCRIFIDKALSRFSDHAVDYVHLYLKTENGFDSAIQSIYFDATSRYVTMSGQGSTVVHQQVTPFLGAGDFWEVDIQVTANNDWGVAAEGITGHFTVTTASGTQYILSANNGDFVIDDNMAKNLESVLGSNGIAVAWPQDPLPASPDRAFFTAQSFPYLNSNGCN